jgi:hypothetical protein
MRNSKWQAMDKLSVFVSHAMHDISLLSAMNNILSFIQNFLFERKIASKKIKIVVLDNSTREVLIKVNQYLFDKKGFCIGKMALSTSGEWIKVNELEKTPSDCIFHFPKEYVTCPTSLLF